MGGMYYYYSTLVLYILHLVGYLYYTTIYSSITNRYYITIYIYIVRSVLKNVYSFAIHTHLSSLATEGCHVCAS